MFVDIFRHLCKKCMYWLDTVFKYPILDLTHEAQHPEPEQTFVLAGLKW